MVIQKHNEVRDTLRDVAAMMYGGVLRESVGRETEPDGKVTVLIADWGFVG